MSTDCLRNGFVPNLLLDGRFETLSPLNHGSFGMVFLARDITNGDHVAIKCVSKGLPGTLSPTGAASVDHSLELNAHKLLGSHPNVVNMIHAFEDEMHMFLVLEFCPMGDLYEAIRVGRGPLETEHVRSFMLQLIDAVSHMHSKGLYHRDIKPENIMIAQDGSLKLGDFGLSTTDALSNEASVGSDRYMAPEQYDPGEDGYSPAQADIWAIGICLLNTLFARNPFVTPSEADVLFRDFVNDKQALFDIFPALSKDTFEVLEHSLCMDPTRRNLTEMRKAIGRVLSFTADDDIFDEFCVEERDVVPASANRQPLRTPSIQSPQPDGSGAFDWSKPYLSPIKTSRQLSAIPDHHDDELFAEQPGVPIEGAAPYASIDSLIDSALGESIKSIKLQQPKPRNMLASVFKSASRRDSTAPQNVGGSLPVTASKPIRALSYIFGKKDQGFSKSWSDLLDEEEDDDYLPMPAADKNRPFEPANNWSSDSLGIEFEPEAVDLDVTPRPHSVKPVDIPETKSVPIPGAASRPRSRTPARRAPESPIFGGDSSSEDVSSYEGRVHAPIYKLPEVYSPPAKRGNMDRWAALGNKRRAFKSQGDLKKAAARQPAREINEHNRTKSGHATTSERAPRRERKNTGGSWRRTEEINKENFTNNKQPTNSVFGFGGRMGQAFGFGERDSNVFGFGRKEQHGFNSKFTKEIPKHDMVRIVDWRKGVRQSSVVTEIAEDDADLEWVGGWHDLQL